MSSNLTRLPVVEIFRDSHTLLDIWSLQEGELYAVWHSHTRDHVPAHMRGHLCTLFCIVVRYCETKDDGVVLFEIPTKVESPHNIMCPDILIPHDVLMGDSEAYDYIYSLKMDSPYPPEYLSEHRDLQVPLLLPTIAIPVETRPVPPAYLVPGRMYAIFHHTYRVDHCEEDSEMLCVMIKYVESSEGMHRFVHKHHPAFAGNDIIMVVQDDPDATNSTEHILPIHSLQENFPARVTPREWKRLRLSVPGPPPLIRGIS